jgi:hypothetical protein
MSGRTIKVAIETLAKELRKTEGIGQKMWDDYLDLERRQNRSVKTEEGKFKYAGCGRH